MLTVRPLGQVPHVVRYWSLPTPQRYQRVDAWIVMLAGLTSAFSLVLFARGNNRAAYTIGVAGALVGAAISAIQIMSEPATRDRPVPPPGA